MRQEINFEQYQNMIRKLAWKWTRTTGLEFDDLASLGDEVFVNCLRAYNPERAAFGTLLYRSLQNAFHDWANKEVTRRTKECEIDEELCGTVAGEQEEGEFLQALLNRLTPAAREVVRATLELVDHPDQNAYKARLRVVRHMVSRSRTLPKDALTARWTRPRVRLAFQEIERAIRELDVTSV